MISFAQNLKKSIAQNYALQYLILLLLIVEIILIRSPEKFLLPTLSVEDGTSIFSYYSFFRQPSSIFRFKSGYMPLIQNIIGYVSIWLPPRLIPYFYAGIPLSFALIAYSIFFSREYRIYVSSDSLRFIICLCIALNPLTIDLLVSNVDYSTWNFSI